MSDSEDEYIIPLARPAAYGAGIKKRGIKFVGAGHLLSSTSHAEPRSGDDIANAYLGLVLDKPKSSDSSYKRAESKVQAPSITVPSPTSQPRSGIHTDQATPTTSTAACAVCNLPLQGDQDSSWHDSTIAHQVCLAHTHPPSAIDRTRKGVVYLQSHGWDPDSRLGLGAHGEGIRHPIAAKEKKGRAGLGQQHAEKRRSTAATTKGAGKGLERPRGLDPKALKKLDVEKRSRGERLREMFYMSEDVEKYLGYRGDV